MKYQRGAFMGIAAIGALGLGVAGALGFGLKKVSDTANERISSLQAVLDQRSADLIRAIPGERYLQLIDDLNGEDEQKRVRAQAFLTKLGGIKLDGDMAASAAFGFDEKEAFRAQMFASTTKDPSSVRVAFERGEIENLKAVRSTISPAPTPAELRQGLMEAYAALIDDSRVRMDLEHIQKFCPRVNLMAAGGDACFKQAQMEAKYQRIVDASLRAYHQGAEQKPLGDAVLSIDWNQLRHKYVIVAVLESDLLKHSKDSCVSDGTLQLEGKGCISIWVHKKGKPNEFSYSGGHYEIAIGEFLSNEPVVWNNGRRANIRWAARRMDPAQIMDEEALQATLAVRKLEAELQQHGQVSLR